MRAIRALTAGVAAALLAGCGHYQLGSSAELPFDRLYVAPITVAAPVPAAAQPTSAALRDAFVGSPVALADAPDGAARLEVTLVGYQRSPVTALPRDTGRGETFDLTLTAEATLRAPDDTVLLQDRRVTARTTALADGNFTLAERQAMPALAEDLARQLRDLTLNVW